MVHQQSIPPLQICLNNNSNNNIKYTYKTRGATFGSCTLCSREREMFTGISTFCMMIIHLGRWKSWKHWLKTSFFSFLYQPTFHITLRSQLIRMEIENQCDLISLCLTVHLSYWSSLLVSPLKKVNWWIIRIKVQRTTDNRGTSKQKSNHMTGSVSSFVI